MNKIREQFNKIIKWYDSLNSGKKLVATVFLLVILIILVSLVSKIDFDTKILNYKEITAENLITNSEISNDRTIYLKANTIIDNLLKTYDGEYYINEEKVKLDDYHKYAIFDEYNISKSKLKKKVQNIENAIEQGKTNENEFYPLIKNIYKYSDTHQMYVVELNTNIRHIIGLKFDNNNRFTIFYIE